MGEAKRRKTLDPNFGRPAPPFRPSVSYVAIDMSSPMPDEANQYEKRAQSIATANNDELWQNALAVRKQFEAEALCLSAIRSPWQVNSIHLRFQLISQAASSWKGAFEAANFSDTAHLDSLFSEASKKLKPGQFLWTHLDINRSGVAARLIPISNNKIAEVCGSRNSTDTVLAVERRVR